MTTKEMSMVDRMEATEIINCLVGDDESYDPDLAARLIELIPITAALDSPDITIGYNWGGGDGITGLTPGFGEVSLPDPEGKEARVIRFRPNKVLHMGYYRVSHIPGKIVIKGMWYGTGGRYDEERAHLVYHTGHPKDGRRTHLESCRAWTGRSPHMMFRIELYMTVWKLPTGVVRNEMPRKQGTTSRWILVAILFGLFLLFIGIFN